MVLMSGAPGGDGMSEEGGAIEGVVAGTAGA